MLCRVKISVLILLLIFPTSATICQTLKSFKQPAHVFPETLSWWDSIYHYPEFRKGHIVYFTGFTHDQDLRLNYNLYFGQMDMIDSKGDTVRLNPHKTIQSIHVGNDVFYVDQKKGYLRVIIQGEVALVEHKMLRLHKADYVSGNNSADGGEYGDVRGRPSIYDKYYVNLSSYFLMDNKNKFYRPSKNTLTKIFPEYKVAINDYVRGRSVNFLDEDDLRKLIQFCNGLRRIPSNNVQAMTVRANEHASVALRDSTYHFEDFQEGVVVYQDKQQRRYAEGLNYNLISGEMEVIENKDTARIKNGGLIATVNINGTLYFRKQEGYIEILLSGTGSLGVTRRIALIHSQPSESSSKYTVDMYDAANASDEVVNFDRMFAKQNRYFFIDARGKAYPASPTSILRLYRSREKDIDQYITSHHTDFSREDDLKDIMTYLSEVRNKR